MLKKFSFIERMWEILGAQPQDEGNAEVATLSDFLLRDARYTDIKQLIHIQKEVYHGVVSWGKTIFLNEFNGPHPVKYLVAEYKKELIGFAGIRIEGSVGHITNVAVTKKFQRKGLGTCFIHRLLDFARYHQCETVILEVKESNVDAQKLYEQLGFLSMKVKKSYYNNNEDGIVMELSLKDEIDER
ncbi:ribosomal protein S18-alanine N-acetyltransferase [Vagococcus elongatus]|uniref:Ribosomal-protein-alanine N-acetyltransferase n=1 Tax=Vagococcus elongatus TaxID=180344 RepID=A0A430B1Z3_9ENTE|nr:ribosomal protein S18-alanine N-acetyltransferase [Vagococcus elongatus]RSU14346.1 ribosomal-protein-alanine N-acetyltransferase [Vagococcus elongatus]